MATPWSALLGPIARGPCVKRIPPTLSGVDCPTVRTFSRWPVTPHCQEHCPRWRRLLFGPSDDGIQNTKQTRTARNLGKLKVYAPPSLLTPVFSLAHTVARLSGVSFVTFEALPLPLCKEQTEIQYTADGRNIGNAAPAISLLVACPPAKAAHCKPAPSMSPPRVLVLDRTHPLLL